MTTKKQTKSDTEELKCPKGHVLIDRAKLLGWDKPYRLAQYFCKECSCSYRSEEQDDETKE